MSHLDPISSGQDETLQVQKKGYSLIGLTAWTVVAAVISFYIKQQIDAQSIISLQTLNQLPLALPFCLTN